MSTPAIIIIVILVVANGTLVVSAICKHNDNQKQLDELRRAKIAEGVLESEIDDDDLKDEIEPQQRYSWIFGCSGLYPLICGLNTSLPMSPMKIVERLCLAIALVQSMLWSLPLLLQE